MSNSSALVLFFQSMLSLYACCGFSVPALCNTDDRRCNIDNFHEEAVTHGVLLKV